MKENENLLNTTMILRMVIMTLKTKIEMMGINDKIQGEKNWDNEHYVGEE